jgi:hypothetical protein
VIKHKEAAIFEKSAQKLLLIWDIGVFTSTAQINKVFLLLFWSQKEDFFLIFLHST